MSVQNPKLLIALPKGRILEELQPLLQKSGIIPEADFFDEGSRKLRFSTHDPAIDLIRVRAFDVATFIAYGGAPIGVAGSDAIEEFSYSELYSPVDLRIGRCRLSLAVPQDADEKALFKSSHLRVATKYPNVTARYFASRGIQAECVRLGGAMEIAPALGLAPAIVDLVSTGQTLKANGLKECKTLLHVSSRLIVGRSAWKTDNGRLKELISSFQKTLESL